MQYAAYGSHYLQYCGDDGDVDPKSFPNGVFTLNYAIGAHEEEGHENGISLDIASESNDESTMKFMLGRNHTHDMNKLKVNQSLRSPKTRKRARMLHFLDRRFARLQLKSNYRKSSLQSSKSSSNSKNNDKHQIYEYEERKAAWAAKYTSVSTLRKSFGTNKNRIWGDFDPTTTRKLYHTLLPRALLELRGLRDGLLSTKDSEQNEEGNFDLKQRGRKLSPQVDASANPEDTYLQQELKELAPLAYQARVAAKKYARERSRLPARLGSMLYDGYRSWRRYGKFRVGGMTWEQVWNKYEDQVLKEAMEELEEAAAVGEGDSSNDDLLSSSVGSMAAREDFDDEELTARICMRILERSVATNAAVDKLFLKRLEADDEEEEVGEPAHLVIGEESRRNMRRRRQRQRAAKLRIQADLAAIEKKFDEDIRELLRYSNLTTREADERRAKKKKGAFFWKKANDTDSSVPTLVDGDGAETITSAESAMAETSTVASAADSPPDDSDQMAAAMFSMSEVPASDDVGKEGQQKISSGDKKASLRGLAVHEVLALRILATTKKRITSLRELQSGTATDKKEDK